MSDRGSSDKYALSQSITDWLEFLLSEKFAFSTSQQWMKILGKINKMLIEPGDAAQHPYKQSVSMYRATSLIMGPANTDRPPHPRGKLDLCSKTLNGPNPHPGFVWTQNCLVFWDSVRTRSGTCKGA